MGRPATLILAAALACLLAGCGVEAKTNADAQKVIFAPTDVNSLPPEMKPKVDAIDKKNAETAPKPGS